MIDANTQDQIQRNLFEAAHAAIPNWATFPWHRSGGRIDTHVSHSSQALAIDVFGTFQSEPERDAVLDGIAQRFGLPAGGPWTIELEWTDPANRLRETGAQSQIDAIARSPHTVIFFECKFTERDGGTCSQTQPKRGQAQCSGNYEAQVNPINGKAGKCALTEKGIRYWELAPEVFTVDPTRDYQPCPFRGPWYQWMRNLVLCAQYGKDEGLKPAFLVVFADRPGLPMADKVHTSEWQGLRNALKPNQIVFEAVSYQSLIAQAQTAVGEAGVRYQDLEAWVSRKIAQVPLK